MITPSLGSELVTNGGFENWTSPTNLTSWTESTAGTSTINQETTATHGGSNAVRLDIDASGSNAQITQGNPVIGTWYQYSFWGKSLSGTPGVTFGNDTNTLATNITTTYTNYIQTNRATATTSHIIKRGQNASSNSLFLDDYSVKPLTLSSLFSTVSTSDSDVIADTNVTLTAGTQAGIVTNLDSTSNPQNFIIVYHDGTNLKVDEAVAGVYTNKQSTAVAIGAGALRVIRDGTKLRAYLNNALVGAELTMTANTNTKHGLFSTYSGNSFDNFTLWARGTGGEFSALDFSDPTLTRDTGIKYLGAGSALCI